MKPGTYYNRFPPTMRQGTTTIGDGETSLQASLIRLRVKADFNIPVPTPFTYGSGEQIILKPDAHVRRDPSFTDGVFEVDGSSHKGDGAKRWDRRKDEIYEAMGLWCERLKPSEAKRFEKIKGVMEKHRR